MSKYKCLKIQRYELNEFALVPIRFEDRHLIMNWRNEQMYHLRQNKLLTAEDQENYFVNIIGKEFEQEAPKQILFSFLKNGECIGYGGLVHINWIDKNAEISFIMATQLEKYEFDTNWSKFLELIEVVTFKELMLHKISTYAFDLRPHLCKILEMNNFSKEAILKEHASYRDNFINVIIHSKINLHGRY